MTEFVLVSCSKSKQSGIHRAADLYEPSRIFRKRREFAQERGDHWGVLSAKHGYLRPWDAVEEYERHITDRTEIWGAFALEDLLRDLEHLDIDTVTVLAGSKYVGPLVTELEAAGYDVVDYNNGLRPGERYSKLKNDLQPGEQQQLVTDGGRDTPNPSEFDTIADYIQAAMAEDYTITADEFKGRPCAYCGTTISFADWPESVVTWDTEVIDPETGEKEPYIQRDYFCSEQCRHDAQRDGDWLRGERHDDGDSIHVDKKELMTDGGHPDLLGYCDRCSSIHRPSEPHKGAVADGGLVAEGEVTDAFLRARLATAYRTEGEIRCDACDDMVDLSKGNLATAIAAWNDHVADCGGGSDE